MIRKRFLRRVTIRKRERERERETDTDKLAAKKTF